MMVVGITMSTSTHGNGTYNASLRWIKPSRGGEGNDLWTREDYYHETHFCNAEFLQTRFSCRDILTKMRIAHNKDELLADMNLGGATKSIPILQ